MRGEGGRTSSAGRACADISWVMAQASPTVCTEVRSIQGYPSVRAPVIFSRPHHTGKAICH